MTEHPNALDGENQGRMVPWQIREFPENLRDAITEQARKEGVKVGELLARLVLEANENGWTFKNFDTSAKTSSDGVFWRRDAFVGRVIEMGQAGLKPAKKTLRLANRALQAQGCEAMGDSPPEAEP